VSQESGDKAPSIYIFNIREINRGTSSSPGLYHTAKGSVGQIKGPRKVSSSNVDGKKIYVNGASQTVEDAMDHAKYATDDNNAMLFYCPTTALDELGPLGRSAKSRATKTTLDELA